MHQKRDPSEIVQEVSAAPAGMTPPYFFSQNTPKEGEELGDLDSTIHTQQQSLGSGSFKHGIWDRYLARGPNSQDDFADGAGSSCGAVCQDNCTDFRRELRRKVHTRNPTLGTATRTLWSTLPPANRASRCTVAEPPLFAVQ